MHLSTLPAHRFQLDPDGPALSEGAIELTNRDMFQQVSSVAKHLRELGVGVGDVVAAQLNNRVEFIVLMFAAWQLGAVLTPVNPSLTPVEVVRQLRDSSAILIVVEDVGRPLDGISIRVLHHSDLRRDGAQADTPPHEDPLELALLIYTSGTTGAPKGVMLDHTNLLTMAEMCRSAMQVTDADRSLLVLPLFHVNGILVSVLTPLLAGGSVSVAGRFDAKNFFALVESHRPTYFSGVPTIFSMLATLPADHRPDTSGVRFALCGAAAAPPELHERFERRYGIPILEAYGLSEATCGSTINPLDGPRKPGSVGIAFPGQEVRVHRPDGQPVVAGQVVVRGPNVMRGYLGRPEDTAAVLVDGWLRTGDIGYLDDDGYLTLVGRSKEMIIRGGENIYPKEVEDTLASHHTVLEAAVIGIPDDKWGEVVIGYVTLEPGRSIEPEALLAYCAEFLAGHKRPIAIHVLDRLPRNAIGKIAKYALRERYAISATSPD